MHQRHDTAPLRFSTKLLIVAVGALTWILLCGCQVFGDRDAMAKRQADAIAQLNQMQTQVHALQQQRQADREQLKQELRSEAASIASQQIEAWGQSQAVDVNELTREIADTITSQQREQIAPQVQQQIEDFAAANGVDAAEVLDSLRSLQESVERKASENEQKLAQQDAVIQEYKKAIEDTRASIPDEEQRTGEVRDAVVSALTGLLAQFGPWGAGAAVAIAAGRSLWRRRGDSAGQGGPANASSSSNPPPPATA